MVLLCASPLAVVTLHGTVQRLRQTKGPTRLRTLPAGHSEWNFAEKIKAHLKVWFWNVLTAWGNLYSEALQFGPIQVLLKVHPVLIQVQTGGGGHVFVCACAHVCARISSRQ